jgi:hypothetical protein
MSTQRICVLVLKLKILIFPAVVSLARQESEVQYFEAGFPSLIKLFLTAIWLAISGFRLLVCQH